MKINFAFFARRNASHLCLLLAIAAGVAAFGCSVVNLNAAAPQDKPADFAVEYSWRSGSIAPQYQYRYNLAVKPDGAAEIAMQYGFDKQVPLNTKAAFKVEAKRLDELYRVLSNNQMFARDWRQTDDPPTGGSFRDLTVTADKTRYTLKDYLIKDQRTDAAQIFEAIEKLVPQNVQDKLTAEREAHQKTLGD